MKILGHPLHMMLIHFPAALFPMDLVCSLIFCVDGSNFLGCAAAYATFGGVCIGWLAVLTGAADLVPLIKHKPALISKTFLHGAINTIVVTGFSVFALRYLKFYPDITSDTAMVLVLKSFLVFFMFIGNFIGGSLVIKDRVGVE